MPEIDATEPLLVVVRYIQMIFLFVCSVGFLYGLFLFIYSFKNPLKRRRAYVLTVLMPLGILLVIHGPVVLLYYVFSEPAMPDPSLGLYLFEPKLEILGGTVWDAVKRIIAPLMVAVIIIALSVLHHASRIPGRKRIAYGIFVGLPILWLLIVTGPDILNILTS